MPIKFHIETFNNVLLSLILLLGLLMLWKELKAKDRNWITFRIIGVLLLIFSLVVILLKPSISVKTNKQNVLFITPFSDSLKVQEWIINNPQNLVWNLNEKNTFLSESKLLDLAIDTLFWSGVGFTKKERAILENVPTKWIVESIKKPHFYIDSLNASRRIFIKSIFIVEAIFYSESVGHTIVYEGFTGFKDSIIVKAGINKLRFKEEANLAGKFVAKIVLKNTNGNLGTLADVPVIVEEPNKISVLLLSSYPNFENRYLKEWLVNQGHEVVYRVAVSREKYRDEFYNSSFKKIPEFKIDFIKNFDFILADAMWLNQFNSSQINQLKSSLNLNNQALIILMDDNISNLKTLHPALLFENARTQNEITFTNNEGVKFPFSFASKSLNVGSSIINGQKDLGTWIKVENSRIASLHFTDSYRLILQDKKQAYTELWSSIFSALGKQINLVEWSLISHWPTTLENIQIELTTQLPVKEVSVIPQTYKDQEVIQNVYLPSTYGITFLTESSGWHQIRLNRDTVHDFNIYVQKTNTSQYFKHTEKLKENLHFFNKQFLNPKLTEQTLVVQKIPIWPFFALFLISAGFLWLIPRI